MSEAECKETYVSFIPEGHIDLVPDATYIMILNPTDEDAKDDVFVLGASGYSLFRLDLDEKTSLNDITRTTHKEKDF